MISLKSFFTLLFLAIPTSSGSPCKRNDPDFNKCVATQMNLLRTTIKNGLPELKIAPLDPMFVPKIRLRQGSGPVSLDLIATNQTFLGLSNYNITSAKVDLAHGRIEYTVFLPWFYVEGQNQIQGKMLVLPITGKGDGWSNYTTVTGKAVLKGHTTQKGGKEFFNLDNVKFDMTVKKAKMFMDNMFNGNKEIGDAVNKIMEDNWEVVFQELKPVINETVQEIIKDIASKIFKRYSLDDMFPK